MVDSMLKQQISKLRNKGRRQRKEIENMQMVVQQLRSLTNSQRETIIELKSSRKPEQLLYKQVLASAHKGDLLRVVALLDNTAP